MKLSSLVLRNIHRHRRSFSFSMIGIVVGVTTFIVFLALGEGLQQNVLERVFVVNQLEVVPRRYNVGAFQGEGNLFSRGTGLDEFTADDLRDLPGVVAVYPKMQLAFPSVASGGEELFGRRFWTELLADGISPELVAGELPAPGDPDNAFVDWDEGDFTCQQPDGEGTGWDVGCPSGRTCTARGICERLPCNPPNEVLAAADHDQTEHVRACLAQRMQDRRGLGLELREADAERLPEGDDRRFRLVVAPRYLDEARRLLAGLLPTRRRRLHHAAPEGSGQGAEQTSGTSAGGVAEGSGEVGGRGPRVVSVAGVEVGSGQGSGDGTGDGTGAGTGEGTGTPVERLPCEDLPSQLDVSILRGDELSCADPPSYCPPDTRHCEMPIPIVTSPFLFEIFDTNLQTILSGSNRSMPRLTRDGLIGFTFDITLGRGVLGDALRLEQAGGTLDRRVRLVGWTPRAMRLGATMPLGYVRRFNTLFKGEEAAEEYHAMLVVARRSQDLASIADAVQRQLGLGIDDSYEMAKRGSLMISLLTIGLVFISGLIIGLASLNIAHTFLMVIAERRREIGVLRSVGARRRDIRRLVLAEAGLIGLAGAAISIPLALALCKLADWLMAAKVPDFPFKPDSLFAFEPYIFLAAIGIAVGFALIGAFFPAARASRMDPAEALRGE